jgi:hypothetical protein
VLAHSVRYHYGYPAAPMKFAQTTENVQYTFASPRELPAKATPPGGKEVGVAGGYLLVGGKL